MEKKIIIIILVALLLVIGVVVAFISFSGPAVEYPMVQGYFNGQIVANVLGGNETPESCREWALSNELPAFGYRNENHPVEQYKTSCFGYHKAQPYLSNLDDNVHSVGCTNPYKNISDGCK